MAGKSFLKLGQTGIGTQTTAERTAGVSTATGTTTFDVTDSKAKIYTGDTDGWAVIGDQSGSIEATGGTKITDSGSTYHVFFEPGPFSVTNAGNVDFLLVGGGGAMTSNYGSGGGGGGIAHGQGFAVTIQDYPVIVGAGGTGKANPGTTEAHTEQAQGNNTTFGGVTALGGGCGFHDVFEGSAPSTAKGRVNGGSGGGTGDDAQGGAGVGLQPSQPTHGGVVTNYGRPGFAPELGNGPGPGNQNCGGGGASEGGDPSVTSAPGAPISFVGTNDRQGGDGQAFPGYPAPVLEPGIPSPRRSAWTTAVGPTGLFGGGGGGGGNTPGPYVGGTGGGGNGNTSSSATAENGVENTGGGGGAAYTSNKGGHGGDGICIIKYPT